MKQQNIICVEMEAAALYAGTLWVCYLHFVVSKILLTITSNIYNLNFNNNFISVHC